MLNLLKFLKKIKVLLLFIVLQIFALSLIVSHNVYHRSVYFNSTNWFIGNTFSIKNSITRYFDLRRQNELLIQENTELRKQLKVSYLVRDSKEYKYNDSVYQQVYEYVSANVISYTSSLKDNYITLDKGAKQGIEKGMGVFSPQGVVGIVDYVTPNFSLVKSFLHSKSRVSTVIKKSNTVGSAVWDGKDFRYGRLLDIPLHVKMKKGDTLLTSKFSIIFPEGIPVGYIEDFNTNETRTFFECRFRFAVDFSNIPVVYVSKNLIKKELDEIEQLKGEPE